MGSWKLALKEIGSSLDKEAKWNYAFWLQEDQLIIGSKYHLSDPEGVKHRGAWIREMEILYNGKQVLDMIKEEENALTKEEFNEYLDIIEVITSKFIQFHKIRIL